MAPGRLSFGIPEPINGPAVVPDVLLVPLLGFDAAGYRLGYGGGYFDRTLAAFSPRPTTSRRSARKSTSSPASARNAATRISFASPGAWGLTWPVIVICSGPMRPSTFKRTRQCR